MKTVTYECLMCGHQMEVSTQIVKNNAIRILPLCPSCIEKNLDVDIEVMENYIKMQEVTEKK